MKVKTYIFLFLLSLTHFTFGQPGPMGGRLSIKIYNKGKHIELPSENWKIIPTNITLADSTNNPYIRIIPNGKPEKSDFFDIIPEPTPGGGNVSDSFYLDIVHKKDTMRIYTPDFKYQSVELDSIPFKKGVYKIPQTIYNLRGLSKKINGYYDKIPVPNLYGNWDLFTRETYKCYIEKVEDIDWESFYGKNHYEDRYDWRRWQYLYIRGISTNFYFYDNVIVKHKYGSREVTIYDVKDYSDVHYWASGTPRISSLFYKDNALFAIINKGNHIRGIYKLHFIDEEATGHLRYLEKKQVTEEYEAQLKGLKVYDKGYRERETLRATEKYNEIMKNFENK